MNLQPTEMPDGVDAVRPEWWLPKHVNELVRELKKEGVITADEVLGRRFGAAAHPVLRLAKHKLTTGTMKFNPFSINVSRRVLTSAGSCEICREPATKTVDIGPAPNTRSPGGSGSAYAARAGL